MFEKSCVLTGKDRMITLLEMSAEVFSPQWLGATPEKNPVRPVNLERDGDFD